MNKSSISIRGKNQIKFELENEHSGLYIIHLQTKNQESHYHKIMIQ